MPESQHVVIYTDGGCAPNPGIGGWGVVMMYQGHYKELSGGEKESTNNRMELMAAIQGLTALKRPCSVVVHTDSKYVKQGITEWMPGWKKRNWARKGGELKNVELWRELDRQTQRHKVKWQWVKGHAGHEHNERCDVLAGGEIEKLRR